MSDINCSDVCNRGNDSNSCQICSLREKTGHGKLWESPVCKYILTDFGFIPGSEEFNSIYNTWLRNSNIDTTSPHDIDAKLMGISWEGRATKSGQPVKEKYGDGISIKLIKKGCDICMGKLSRIWEHFDQGPWSMIVGFYSEKKIEGVKCLCIESVYYIPFVNQQEGKKAFFGDVPHDFPEKLQNLEYKVKEAWSYKKGKEGVKGLSNDNIEIVPFESLTEKQKDWRRRGSTDNNSSIQDIKDACTRCMQTILSLQEELQPSKLTPSKVAVKISSGNSRVQGRVLYKNFLRLAQVIGSNITDNEDINENNVLLPIKKMNIGSGESKSGGRKRRTKKRKTKKRKSKKRKTKKRKSKRR